MQIICFFSTFFSKNEKDGAAPPRRRRKKNARFGALELHRAQTRTFTHGGEKSFNPLRRKLQEEIIRIRTEAIFQQYFFTEKIPN